eukprot:TRINITY_DN12772_c0_g1_i1.p1 TRINITY_DN12772_c0_g1~~TRINITY_DN12772_c0_g1_i1.p1  ORF type:complete len:135 (+),score=29.18 TRINITY_DN12772_c0_g1_i1:406-810(+)
MMQDQPEFLKRLMQRFFPTLAKIFTTKSCLPTIRSSAFRALVEIALRLKGDMKQHAVDVLNLTLIALSAEDSLIRLNGLKMLGVVLAHAEELEVFVDDSTWIVKITTALNGIANIDSSTEARLLAEKYLDVLKG